jgi:Uncharacterized phage-associated protein
MRGNLSYIIFKDEQLSKIGNTALYMAERIKFLSKTKLLKLFYILDEFSTKKGGIPFVNLTYKVWKFGPVSEELFIDLSSGAPVLMRDFIKKDDNDYIIPNARFNDDEFSDNDIELLDYVVAEFGNKDSNELIKYTHRENSLWHNAAKENGVLDLLEAEVLSNTEYVIDLSLLVEHDPIKSEIYRNYLESC